MPEQEYFKNMYTYIERIPEDDKVSKQLYEERLEICKECEALLNGMCQLCGCYIEMRAVMKIRSCPAVPAKWNAVQRNEEY